MAPIKVTYGMGIEKHDNNGRAITAEFAHFAVVVVYTPNSGNTEEKLSYRIHEWEVDFRQYLVKLRDTLKKPIILAGDLNVAHKEIDINDSNISVFQLEFIR